MSAPVFVPPQWVSFSSAPSDLEWEALGTLARASLNSYHRELSLLLEVVGSWPIDRAGPNGESALFKVLGGWDRLGIDGPGSSFEGAGKNILAQLPLPGEAAWDGAGFVEGWALPAALLVARGMDPFVPDARGETAFARALQLGSAALVTQMLRLPQAPPFEAWPLVPAGHPGHFHRPTLPLHAAAIYGNIPLLKTLLAAGAPVDQRDAFGRTALMVAANEISTRALLAAGADPMAEDAAGLIALECWSLRGVRAAPASRDEWVKAASKKGPAALSRIKLAALFANESTLLNKIKREPWVPYRGMGPDAWGALGGLVRFSNHDSSAALNRLDDSQWSAFGRALLTLYPETPQSKSRTADEQAALRQHLPDLMEYWESWGWGAARRTAVLAVLLKDPEMAPLAWTFLSSKIQGVIVNHLSAKGSLGVTRGPWTLGLNDEDRLTMEKGVAAIKGYASTAPMPLSQHALFLSAISDDGRLEDCGVPDNCRPRFDEVAPDDIEKIRPLLPVARYALEQNIIPAQSRAWLDEALAQIAALDLGKVVENKDAQRPRQRM